MRTDPDEATPPGERVAKSETLVLHTFAGSEQGRCVQNRSMRIRMTDRRERRLERVMDAMGENTKAGATDRALSHHLADLRNKEQIVDELSTEHVEVSSMPYLPLERETSVGDR